MFPVCYCLLFRRSSLAIGTWWLRECKLIHADRSGTWHSSCTPCKCDPTRQLVAHSPGVTWADRPTWEIGNCIHIGRLKICQRPDPVFRSSLSNHFHVAYQPPHRDPCLVGRCFYLVRYFKFILLVRVLLYLSNLIKKLFNHFPWRHSKTPTIS